MDRVESSWHQKKKLRDGALCSSALLKKLYFVDLVVLGTDRSHRAKSVRGQEIRKVVKGVCPSTISSQRLFINTKYTDYRHNKKTTKNLEPCVYFWSLVFGSLVSEIQTPKDGRNEDGLSAIGTAADLMMSPHQLFLFLSLIIHRKVLLQSQKIWQPCFYIIL